MGDVISNVDTRLANRPAMAERMWKPGQSGNPSGRPRKPLSERLLAQLLKEDEAGVGRIVKALVSHAEADTAGTKAASASVRAITEIFDRVEGKVADRLAGQDGGELVVKIIAVGRE